jgi:predicted NUDIX family NTP pyrophosphohydrolase
MALTESEQVYKDLEEIQKAHDEQKRVKKMILHYFENASVSIECFWENYHNSCGRIRYFRRKYIPKGTEVEEARAKLLSKLRGMIKDLESDLEHNWQAPEEPKTDWKL